ncbi:MAG TPA: hypothetical protein VGF99_09780 [Myxococcota bacterium]
MDDILVTSARRCAETRCVAVALRGVIAVRTPVGRPTNTLDVHVRFVVVTAPLHVTGCC